MNFGPIFLITVLISINSVFCLFDIIKNVLPHADELIPWWLKNKKGEEIDFVTRVASFPKYTAEEHVVVNKDGYNLKLHRISGSPNYPKKPGKKVVFLQHGLAMQSVNYILQGPEKDLVFLLADRGYDVWLGNARGNALSRSNKNIHPTNNSFWDFSYHEIGLDDVSTFIDEVLKKTKQKKLTYIGYSMGTTEIFVLLSSKPEYNEKVNLVIQLAPIAYWKNNFKPVSTLISGLYNVFKNANNLVHLQEVWPLSTTESNVCDNYCRWLTQIMKQFPIDPKRYDGSTVEFMKKTFPAGTSSKTLFHLMQNIKSGAFRKYDYGEATNLKIYGNAEPPEYSLENVKAPVALFYAHGDKFNTDGDIDLLKSKLPNVIPSIPRVRYPGFTHLDFIFANDAKIILYEDIFELIPKYVKK